MADKGRNYVIPNYPVTEITKSMNDIAPELSLQDTEIRKPKAERVQNLYLTMLVNILDINPQQLFQDQIENQYKLSFPELHEQSNKLITLCRAIQRVLYSCGVSNFHIGDLIDPVPKRLITHLSHLLNLYLFKEQRMVVYLQISEENEVNKERAKYLQSKSDELKKQMEGLAEAKVQQDQMANQLQEEIDAKQAIFDETREAANTKNQSIAEKKNGISELITKINQLKLTLSSEKLEAEQLSKKIVQSPDRMRSDKERMEVKYGKLQEDLKLQSQRCEELLLQTERVEMTQDSMDQLHRILDALKDTSESKKERMAEARSVLEEIQKNEDEMKTLTEKVNQSKKQLANMQENLSKMKLQNKKSIAARREDNEQLDRELKQKESQKSSDLTRLLELDTERQRLVDFQGEMERKHEEKMTRLRDKFTELLEVFESEQSAYAEAWTMLTEQFKSTRQV